MTSPSRLPFNNRRSTHDWRGLADKWFNGTTIFTQIIFPTKLNRWMITDLKTKVVLTLSSSKPPLIGLFQIFFWCSVWVVVLGLEQWHFLLFFFFLICLQSAEVQREAFLPTNSGAWCILWKFYLLKWELFFWRRKQSCISILFLFPVVKMLVRFLVPGTDLCGGNAGAVRGAGSWERRFFVDVKMNQETKVTS